MMCVSLGLIVGFGAALCARDVLARVRGAPALAVCVCIYRMCWVLVFAPGGVLQSPQHCPIPKHCA